MGEFELIERYFKRPVRRSPLGVGDDCALLSPTLGMQLAVSSDMLVEGRHFLPTVSPEALGHKALAVNLSDLAACGARPLAFTLALALPRAEPEWLEPFSRGLLALAEAWDCELIGGDTTRGPLCISITVFGEVPRGAALLRSGARPGDALWMSGTVGDARLALEVFRGTCQLPGQDFDAVRVAMERPAPRVGLGLALHGVASSAIDISDGLLGDLQHVLRASHVGVRLEVDAIARSRVLSEQPLETQRLCTLAGGDDYELLFTAPPEKTGQVRAAAEQAGVAVHPIGRITPFEATEADGPEADHPRARVVLVDAQGRELNERFASFDHFRS